MFTFRSSLLFSANVRLQNPLFHVKLKCMEHGMLFLSRQMPGSLSDTHKRVHFIELRIFACKTLCKVLKILLLHFRLNGLFTLNGNGTVTGTGNWTSIIGNNIGLGSFLCFRPVWTFLNNIVGTLGKVPCSCPTPSPPQCEQTKRIR